MGNRKEATSFSRHGVSRRPWPRRRPGGLRLNCSDITQRPGPPRVTFQEGQSSRRVRLCSWFLDGDEKPKTKSDPETARRKAPLVEWA